MKIETIHKEAGKLIEVLDKTDLKIDEKITACRAAAEIMSQVMTMETTVLAMQASIKGMLK